MARVGGRRDRRHPARLRPGTRRATATTPAKHRGRLAGRLPGGLTTSTTWTRPTTRVFVRGLAQGRRAPLWDVDATVVDRRPVNGARASSTVASPGSRRSSTSTSWTASSTASPNTLQAGFRVFRPRADRPRAELRAGHGRRPLLPSSRSIWCFDERIIRKAHESCSHIPILSIVTYIPLVGRARDRLPLPEGEGRGRSRPSRRSSRRSTSLVSLPLWFALRPRQGRLPVRRAARPGSRRSASTTTSGSTGSRSS